MQMNNNSPGQMTVFPPHKMHSFSCLEHRTDVLTAKHSENQKRGTLNSSSQERLVPVCKYRYSSYRTPPYCLALPPSGKTTTDSSCTHGQRYVVRLDPVWRAHATHAAPESCLPPISAVLLHSMYLSCICLFIAPIEG